MFGDNIEVKLSRRTCRMVDSSWVSLDGEFLKQFLLQLWAIRYSLEVSCVVVNQRPK